jgi:acyl-CoA synthetase (NDP forming)
MTLRQLGIKEAEEILKRYNLPFCIGALAKDASQAKEFAKNMGFPVAMKIDSMDVIHKTDSGAVKINVKTEQEAEAAYNEIINNVRSRFDNPRIEGVYIQPMVSGTEIIIGMKRDSQFGPVLAFGLGGIFVEVLKDVSLRIAPIKRENAVAMIKEIRSYKMLEGVRGKPAANIEALIDILLKLSSLVMENQNISELDFNPVFVDDKRALLVDARIMVD